LILRNRKVVPALLLSSDSSRNVSGIAAWRRTLRGMARRRRQASGTVISALVCAPFLLALIFLGVQAAQHHEWGRLAGFVLIAVIFVAVPAGGLTWLTGGRISNRQPQLPSQR
jgi:uncharacterized membrane protein